MESDNVGSNGNTFRYSFISIRFLRGDVCMTLEKYAQLPIQHLLLVTIQPPPFVHLAN